MRLNGTSNEEDILLLARLKDVARQVGIQVREEDLGLEDDFPVQAGVCRLYGDSVLFMDRRADIKEQVEVLLRCLGGRDLSNIFIVPSVRERIELFGDGRDGSERSAH